MIQVGSCIDNIYLYILSSAFIEEVPFGCVRMTVEITGPGHIAQLIQCFCLVYNFSHRIESARLATICVDTSDLFAHVNGQRVVLESNLLDVLR